MACLAASAHPHCAFGFPTFRPYEPPSCSSLSSPPPPKPACSSSLSPAAQPYQGRYIIVQWRRPPFGWFKLNFDGSVYNDGSGRASIGGAIRDWTGRVLAAFAQPTEHAMVGIVEARALIFGLRLALDLGRMSIVVEGDDLVLVKLLRGEDTYTRIPQAMQDEIIMLLGRFPERDVKHIFREGNQVADALCHEAYQRPGVWMGGHLPRAAWEKARDDAHFVGHERIRKAKV